MGRKFGWFTVVPMLWLALGQEHASAAASKPTGMARKASTSHPTAHKSSAHTAKAGAAHASTGTRKGAHPVLAVRRTRGRRVFSERFTASSFADNLTLGDTTTGEDPVVRAAAVEALGNMNGTALAIDPSSGRLLAMVNQTLPL